MKTYTLQPPRVFDFFGVETVHASDEISIRTVAMIACRAFRREAITIHGITYFRNQFLVDQLCIAIYHDCNLTIYPLNAVPANPAKAVADLCTVQDKVAVVFAPNSEVDCYYRCLGCGLTWSKRQNTPCSDCEDEYSQCCHCNSWVLSEDTTEDNNGTTLCLCCQEDYTLCDNCENWVEIYRTRAGLCSECYDDQENLHSHGYEPNLNFLPTELPNTLYLGVELETDGYDDEEVYKTIRALHDLDRNELLFHLQEDSSLYEGIEIVTQPATLRYHLTKFPWAEIVEIVQHYNGKSHTTSTCGLHVHFNQSYIGDRNSYENDLATLKLLHIFDKYWPQLIKFSRRSAAKLNEWARKYDDDFNSTDKEHIRKAKQLKGGEEGKYYSINLCNYDTIEIRIFRGTLKLNTLFATLEFVDFLVNLVRKHNARYIHRLTWEDMVGKVSDNKYPHLVEYLKERGLCALSSQNQQDSPCPLIAT